MDNLPVYHGSKKQNNSFPYCVLRALLCALLLLPLLLLLGSFIAYRTEDPAALIAPLSYAAALLTAFFCGLIAARRRGGQGLLCGAMAGGALLLLFLLGFFITMGESEIGIGRLLLTYLSFFAVSVLGGVVGGLWPAGKPRRIRRPKKH